MHSWNILFTVVNLTAFSWKKGALYSTKYHNYIWMFPLANCMMLSQKMWQLLKGIHKLTSWEIPLHLIQPEFLIYFPNFSRYFHTICTGSGVPKFIYDIVLSQKCVDTKLNSVDLRNSSQSFEDHLGQRIHASILPYSLFFSFDALGYVRCDKVMLIEAYRV